MGLLDNLMQRAGGLAGVAAKNPQAVAAIVSLLSSRDSSVGGTGGLGGLVTAFQQKGLGSSSFESALGGLLSSLGK